MGQAQMTEQSSDNKHKHPTRLKGFDDFDLTLGDIMRGERATLGKSLLDVQRELKIKANYIAAIENSDPTAFETPGFIAGYVRSYARYLGLDPEWAYNTFCLEGNFTSSKVAAKTGATDPLAKQVRAPAANKAKLRDPLADPSVSFVPKAPAAMSRIEPSAIGSIAVLVALISAIGYGGWSVLQEVQKVQFTPIEEAPGLIAELDPLSSAMAPRFAEDAGALPQASEALDRLYRPQALDVPVLVARDGPIMAIDPSSVGVFADAGDLRDLNVPALISPAAPSLPTEPVQVVADVAPNVALLAARPSWVRVQAADGTVIFEKILDSGERFEVPLTEEPHVLRAGNAGSLYFAVGNQTFGPAGDGPSVVRDIALSVEAVSERFQLADLARDADLAQLVAVAEAQSDAVQP